MLTRRSSPTRIAMLTLALSLLLSASPTSSAEKGGGVWTSSASGCPGTSGFGSCGGNQVCGDWDVDGETVMSCCIEPEFLSTSYFEACGG